MKKSSLSLFLLFTLVSCRNLEFSHDVSLLSADDIRSVRSGLVLKVRNSIPGETATTPAPDLNAYVCPPVLEEHHGSGTSSRAYAASSRHPSPRRERCIQLMGVIRAGTEESFIVTPQILAAVMHEGAVSFEFGDNQQTTTGSWGCYRQGRVAIDQNIHSRQDWLVVVNQRHEASYGCHIFRQ